MSSTMSAVEAILEKAKSEGKTNVTAISIAFTLGYVAGQRASQQAKLHRLVCQPQNYAWGKVGRSSKVARLMEADGLEVDESKPYAEYWFGTHPAAPSSIQTANGDRLLSQWLVDTPIALGRLQPIAGATGQLPFLFKVLSVAKALSIQAHPDKALAERLHAERPEVYKDDNHKPEMAVALTYFEAMCGFRPYGTIVTLLGEYPEFAQLVGKAVVDEFVAAATGAPTQQRAALKAMFTAWMKCDDANRQVQLEAMLGRLSSVTEPNELQKLLLRLSEQYPGDVGIFAPLMLNYLQLQPGQAIFLAANEPHAYLAGDIVECMACSNNVVRAGLTPKLRDVDTLCEMLTYKCFEPASLLVQPQVRGKCLAYVPPIDEFVITRVELEPGESQELEPQTSPCLLLVTEGSLHLSGKAVSEGATYLEAAAAEALVASVPGAAESGAKLYRVYAKPTFN